MRESHEKAEVFGSLRGLDEEFAGMGAEIRPGEASEGEIPETSEKREETRTIPFYPDLAISEATAVFWILSALSFLVIFFPAQLEVKANPMVTPAGSKPEWYFLFLYAFLRFVPPAIGVMAPIIGTGLLFLLPWLDRNPERSPDKRVLALLGGTILLTIIAVLTVIGYSQ